MIWRPESTGSVVCLALLLGGLISCRPAPTPPTAQPTAPPAGPTQNAPQSESDAVITEIAVKPVWVQVGASAAQTPAAGLSGTPAESPAEEGMGLTYGDTIRTAEQALAEVRLASGLAFRIGGTASLTLQPGNRLNLESGQMITWVAPGQQVPAEIITPAGIAGLRGTTLFVDLPEDPAGDVEFFAWEGTIAVRPLGASEEVVITSGEQLSIRPGESDVVELRQRVRRLTQEEIEQRRSQSRLLNSFSQPLPTQQQIDDALGSQE